MDSRCRWLATVFLLGAFALGGCSKNSPTPASTLSGGKSTADESGVASWYGVPFNGRQTADGEIYDMEALTAAHRTYAFGTVVHVVNTTNGKTIDVRINDRGPFVADRIIDLSHAAAQTIAMPGTTTVNLKVMSVPPGRAVQNFAVQVGSFDKKTEAAGLMSRMQAQYGTAELVFRPGDRTWRVLVGMFPSTEAADALAKQIEPQVGPAFTVALDQ
jgi:rare lipoprotein A